MGISRRPEKVKLIAGLLFNDADKYLAAKKALARRFGRIDFESAPLDFAHTSYYDKEMGGRLKRAFLSFERLIGLENACAVKIRTNTLERRYSATGKRAVNIDPGYLDLSKLVLFSTKDYSHRVYLGKGIFAEVTLFYKDDEFNPWPWTYPDYKSRDYLNIFQSIRQTYKRQIR